MVTAIKDHNQLYIASAVYSYVYVYVIIACFIRIIKVFTKVKFPMMLCHITQTLVSIWGVAPRPPKSEFAFCLNTPASNIFLHHCLRQLKC